VNEKIAALPDLQLDCTQQELDAWHKAAQAIVDDKEIVFVDVNDAVMNFITLQILVHRYPDKLEAAKEMCPEHIKLAMSELGMAMGAARIAEKLNLSRAEVNKIMFKEIFEIQKT
jgi:hypothetical protein